MFKVVFRKLRIMFITFYFKQTIKTFDQFVEKGVLTLSG